MNELSRDTKRSEEKVNLGRIKDIKKGGMCSMRQENCKNVCVWDGI